MRKTELILMILVALLLLGFFCCVVALLIRKIRAKADPEKVYSNRLAYNTASYACILIVAVSWVTNIGWIRLIFFPVIVAYAIIFFLVNHFYAGSARRDSKMRWVNYAVYLTYLLANILMPDAGDTPDSMRAVFGLVDAELGDGFLWHFAALLFFVHFVLVITQTVYTIMTKHKIKKKVGIASNSEEMRYNDAKTSS